ncbi:MAG: hypothetical protein M0Q91_16780 [Methanoregula sp.]|jgi:hypothetical protein|nr:hypothetical protein [Methanoregula sp.]
MNYKNTLEKALSEINEIEPLIEITPAILKLNIRLLSERTTRELMIEFGVGILNNGLKIPIGYYRDCRSMGFYNVKWGIELAIELQKED